jgi:hypothetical protein
MRCQDINCVAMCQGRFGDPFFCDEHDASIPPTPNFVSSETFGVFRNCLDCTARLYFGMSDWFLLWFCCHIV